MIAKSYAVATVSSVSIAPVLAQPIVEETSGGAAANSLRLWSDAPRRVRSTAPLTDETGVQLPQPPPGPAGSAMFLSDRQAGHQIHSCICCQHSALTLTTIVCVHVIPTANCCHYLRGCFGV